MSTKPESTKNSPPANIPTAGELAHNYAPDAGNNIEQKAEENSPEIGSPPIHQIAPINGGAEEPGNSSNPESGILDTRPPEIKIIETPVPVFSICEDVVLVVCGTSAAIELLVKAWEQKAAPAAIIPRIIGTTTFPELITEMMAADNLPDTFILIPANCFPTHRVDLADLTAFRVRRMFDGSKVHYTQLPVLLEATAVLKTMEALDNINTYTAEEFFEKYNTIAHAGELAENIGMSFGNTVAYAEDPNPCMAKLAEAMIRKKFICTSAEGFIPIKERLALLYDGK